VKAKLRLSERTFRCDQCDFVLDRDLRRRPQPRPARGRGCGGTSSPSCVGDGKRARWKPTQDPHLAGSGYRHGKTHTNRRGSTPARQRTNSGHVFTRFLNGWLRPVHVCDVPGTARRGANRGFLARSAACGSTRRDLRSTAICSSYMAVVGPQVGVDWD
jgi:hypothetical protein